MAQFKQFLKQLEIMESSKPKPKSNFSSSTKKVKAISVIGGAKTDSIGSSVLKPPRPITSKKQNPRGVPSNKTHAKSVPIKEQEIIESQKKISGTPKTLTVNATKVPSKSTGPVPIKLKRTNNSEVGSPKSSSSRSSGTFSGQKSIGGGSKANKTSSVADAIFTGISNRPPKDKKPKRKSGIMSKALGILAKKGHAAAHPKGFIHPPLSKTAK